MQIWYRPTLVNIEYLASAKSITTHSMHLWHQSTMQDGDIDQYHFCDHIYYVHLVPADHSIDGAISPYRLCVHDNTYT